MLKNVSKALCSSAFHYCDKIPEENQLIRRKGLFWITISEVSVHGHLVPLPLSLWQHSHHGGSMCLPRGGEGRKREVGRGWGPNIPFKGMPPMTYIPLTGPHLLKVPPPSNSATGWGQAFNRWAFRGHSGSKLQQTQKFCRTCLSTMPCNGIPILYLQLNSSWRQLDVSVSSFSLFHHSSTWNGLWWFTKLCASSYTSL
jgi:hypothetical protein